MWNCNLSSSYVEL